MSEPDRDNQSGMEHTLRAEELAAQRTAVIARTIALISVVPLATIAESLVELSKHHEKLEPHQPLQLRGLAHEIEVFKLR